MRGLILGVSALLLSCSFDGAGLGDGLERSGAVTEAPGGSFATPAEPSGRLDAGPDGRPDWEECETAVECTSGECVDLGGDFGSVCGEACDSSGPGGGEPCPFNLSCIDGYCRPAPDDGGDDDGPGGDGPGGGGPGGN
jgi:hypothetical protein